MKKNLLVSSIILILVLLVTDAEAQRRRRSSYRRRRGGASIALHSINFNAGFYKPGMDYWNDESYIATAGESFEGGILYQAGVELDVYKGFLVGLYAGFYNDDVQTVSSIGGIERKEDLSYRMIPLSIQAKYEVTMGDPRSRYRNTGIAKLHPYFGGGINYTRINQEFTRNFTDDNLIDINTSQKGATVSFSGILGVKYDITRYFGLGAELNYYIGSFDQVVDSTNGGDNAIEGVSLNGPSFNGKLYLKFPGNKRKPNYRRSRRR